MITRRWLHRALLSQAHLQYVFIIGAIVRRQQELLRVQRHPSILLPVTWVGECLDYLMRTIYFEGCCKAVLGEHSLDRYFRQPALTNDLCDSPTYCGRCSTLLWKRDPQLCDAWWGPSTINVNPSTSLGLLFALMSLSRYFFFSVDNSEVSFLILHSWCRLWFICSVCPLTHWQT